MPTPTFCMTIGKEMQGIGSRCEEIDQTILALQQERSVLAERREALDAMRALYKTSQKQIDEALIVQASTSGTEMEPAGAEG